MPSVDPSSTRISATPPSARRVERVDVQVGAPRRSTAPPWWPSTRSRRSPAAHGPRRQPGEHDPVAAEPRPTSASMPSPDVINLVVPRPCRPVADPGRARPTRPSRSAATLIARGRRRRRTTCRTRCDLDVASEQLEQVAPPVAAAVLEHPIVVGEQPGMGGHAHDEVSSQRRNEDVGEKGLGVVEVLEARRGRGSGRTTRPGGSSFARSGDPTAR